MNCINCQLTIATKTLSRDQLEQGSKFKRHPRGLKPTLAICTEKIVRITLAVTQSLVLNGSKGTSTKRRQAAPL